MTRWPCIALLLVGAAAGCGGDNPPAAAGDDAPPPEFEPPVLISPNVPVRYPPALFREGTGGTVVLQLFVDETGALLADSVRIAEGSGVAALDSAALEAVAAMRFAPARREGRPVAVTFLQPVQFERPDSAAGTEGGA